MKMILDTVIFALLEVDLVKRAFYTVIFALLENYLIKRALDTSMSCYGHVRMT